MKRSISFAERIAMRYVQPEPIEKSSPVFVPVKIERNGFFTEALEAREMDKDQFANLSANDFCLAAVIASNSADFLKPTSPMGNEKFFDESAVIRGLESIKEAGMAFEPETTE